MSNLLTFAAAQFNVPRNLSDVQVALLVDDLLERYWHWRFDEFVYLCREAIAGRWGCHYATIDAPTVHSWCLAYAEVREAELERAAEQEHKARRLAENAAGPARAANEQAFRRHLETLSDEDLQTGIAFYEAHFDEPHAALKSELAAAVLLDRKRLALLKAVMLPDGHAHAEEISEAEYQAFKARWAAAQQVRPAECLCERAQPGEVCPDCHDSGVFDPAAYDAHSQTLLDEMEAASSRKRAASAA